MSAFDPEQSFLQREMMNIEHVNGDVLVPLFWAAIWVPIDGAAEFAAQQQRGNLIAEAIPFHRYFAFPLPPELAVFDSPALVCPLPKYLAVVLISANPDPPKEQIFYGSPIETLP